MGDASGGSVGGSMHVVLAKRGQGVWGGGGGGRGVLSALIVHPCAVLHTRPQQAQLALLRLRQDGQQVVDLMMGRSNKSIADALFGTANPQWINAEL